MSDSEVAALGVADLGPHLAMMQARLDGSGFPTRDDVPELSDVELILGFMAVSHLMLEVLQRAAHRLGLEGLGRISEAAINAVVEVCKADARESASERAQQRLLIAQATRRLWLSDAESGNKFVVDTSPGEVSVGAALDVALTLMGLIHDDTPLTSSPT